MSAAEALEVARAAGIRVEIDGDDLVLEAPTAPPPGVLYLLSRYKADIVTLLRLGRPGLASLIRRAGGHRRVRRRAAARTS